MNEITIVITTEITIVITIEVGELRKTKFTMTFHKYSIETSLEIFYRNFIGNIL